MKTLIALLPHPVHAGFPYPPKGEGARVETDRTVGDITLRMWIFGESAPAAPKPAIVFFYGGGWKSRSPA